MQLRGPSRDLVYIALVNDDESVCRPSSRLLHSAGFYPVTYPTAEALREGIKRPRLDCLVIEIQLEHFYGSDSNKT